MTIRFGLLVFSVPLLLGALKLLADGAKTELRPEVDFRRERRKTKRIRRDSVFDLDEGDNRFHPGNARLVDISIWGACISTAVPLEMEQKVRGRLRSSQGELLHISGHVAWLKQKDNTSLCGIKFDQITRLST